MANASYWSPQLESQLHCWHQMQALTDRKKPLPCLTIARDFGCQAYPLAEALVKKLNSSNPKTPWIIIGNQVLDEISKLSGYSVEQIKKSQDTPTSVKAIFSMFLDKHLAEETEVFHHLKPVIRNFAKRGNCIFIGRGAVFATQDLKSCTHVRLVAPIAFRVEKIMEIHKLDKNDAECYIDLHQQQRDDFLGRFSDSNINDPELYHLILNNSRLPINSMVDLTLRHLH